MDVLLQLLVWAAMPPNVTVLLPLVDPKLLPVTVTAVPDSPEVGDRLEITGAVAWADTLAANRMKREITGAIRLNIRQRIIEFTSLCTKQTVRDDGRPGPRRFSHCLADSNSADERKHLDAFVSGCTQ